MPKDQHGQEIRILLISPPFIYFPSNRDSSLRQNYTRPPLGLAYLAAYLKRELGEKVAIAIIDGALNERSTILSRAVSFRPDIIGVSAVTGTVTEAKNIAKELRKELPGALFVAGGPHISVLPTDVFPEYDVAIMGEGEIPFLEVVKSWRQDALDDLKGYPGVVFRGESQPEAPPERIENLDILPFPARELLQLEKYFHSYPHRTPPGNFTTLFTSRGCNFRCTYCGGATTLGHKQRLFSLDYIKQEIDEVVRKHKCSLIFFDDDELLLMKDRLKDLCHFLIDQKYPMKWICHGRPEGADLELFKLMRRAGCVEIQVGVESGSEKILKSMRRNYNMESVRRFFDTARKAGILTWATYIVGYPGETEDTVKQTLELAIQTDPTYASFIMLLPFPGSQVYDTLKNEDRILTFDWSQYSWHSDLPVFSHDNFSEQQIVKLRALLLRKFYLRPLKLLQILRHLVLAGKIREISRNFFSWLGLVFR